MESFLKPSNILFHPPKNLLHPTGPVNYRSIFPNLLHHLLKLLTSDEPRAYGLQAAYIPHTHSFNISFIEARFEGRRAHLKKVRAAFRRLKAKGVTLKMMERRMGLESGSVDDKWKRQDEIAEEEYRREKKVAILHKERAKKMLELKKKANKERRPFDSLSKKWRDEVDQAVAKMAKKLEREDEAIEKDRLAVEQKEEEGHVWGYVPVVNSTTGRKFPHSETPTIVVSPVLDACFAAAASPAERHHLLLHAIVILVHELGHLVWRFLQAEEVDERAPEDFKDKTGSRVPTGVREAGEGVEIIAAKCSVAINKLSN